jgi:methionine salvage enolase-phosphatase E1
MFELEQELDIPSHLRFHNSKQETLEEAAQSHLSKVADGKEQLDMLMKTSQGAIWQQQRSYTEEEMKLFARSYQ